MTARTLPIDLNLTVYPGATLVREFRWRPDGVTGQDFTGWTARLLIGYRRGRAVRQYDSPDAITLSDDGLIHIEVPAADTAEFGYGSLIYSLDLTDPLARVLRFLRGRIVVADSVEPLA